MQVHSIRLLPLFLLPFQMYLILRLKFWPHVGSVTYQRRTAHEHLRVEGSLHVVSIKSFLERDPSGLLQCLPCLLSRINCDSQSSSTSNGPGTTEATQITYGYVQLERAAQDEDDLERRLRDVRQVEERVTLLVKVSPGAIMLVEISYPASPAITAFFRGLSQVAGTCCASARYRTKFP